MDLRDKKSSKKKKQTSVTSPIVLERRIIPEVELDQSMQRFYFNYFDDELKKKPHKKELDIENVFKKDKKEKKKQRESMQSFATGSNHEQQL